MILFIAAASVTGSDVLAQDVQALAPGFIVELFELDLTPFGGELLRFHAGTNGLSANVTWNGQAYTAFPVMASGFEFSGQGQMPRPKMVVSNVVGSITALVLQYEDLVGAKVTRRRTLAKYLDAVNFAAGNTAADPTAEFPADIYYIDRKSVETNELVEFELAPAMDVTGVMLPRRQIIQNICPWQYRGSECSYTGTNYFDTNDVSVGSLGLDACGKRLSSCKARFGQYAELPFGGFPVAGLFR
jgi:lambda family phage minor tail protein L